MKKTNVIALLPLIMIVGGCIDTSAETSIHTVKKLMSYNVRHCAGMDQKVDPGRIARTIMVEKPDFVGLQELDVCTSRSNGVDQPSELGRITGLYSTFGKTISFAGGEYGIMILSREKPLQVMRIPLPGKEPRLLLLCEFDDCVFGTTHLSVAEESERIESIGIIRNAIKQFSKTKPVFLSGDWNSTPESSVLVEMEKFIKVISKTDAQTFHGGASVDANGNNIDWSMFCIDYIACDAIHSGQIHCFNAEVIDDRVSSDHAPIVVTVESAK